MGALFIGACVPRPASPGATANASTANASAASSSHNLVVPVDPAATATVDLVDLAQFDPRLLFDIRYATTANFMGRVLYPVARAMAQRPAAAALR
ncbi:MAG: hypothetical protein ACKOUM_02790, partial [Sphingopyxis sp.]